MGNHVMDPISSFTDKRGPLTALAAYADSTSWKIDVRGQNDKVILVKNAGAAALTVSILASIDDETDGALEWDYDYLASLAANSGVALVPVTGTLTEVSVPAGGAVSWSAPLYCTYLKIQVKGVGGIANIKAAATGN